MGFFDSGSFGIDLGINPGEWFGDDRPDEQRAQNVEQQKEFAKNSIQWKVADAKAAGLHPLFGAGLSGSSFSPNPITVGDGTSISARPGTPADGIQRRANQQAHPGELEKNQDARLERQANNDHAATMSRIATDTEQQALLRAQTDLVKEQIQDSLAARAGQKGVQNKERSVVRPTPTEPQDAWEIVPREITVGVGELGHGPIAVGPPGAAFEPVYLAPNYPILVPNGAAQNLGDMELSGWLISAAATFVWHNYTAAKKVIETAARYGKKISESDVMKKAAELSRQYPGGFNTAP